MKKRFMTLALVAVCATAFAASPDPQGAATVIETQSTEILNDLNAHKAQYQGNPAAFNGFINREVLPHFALDKMTQFVLGQHRAAVQQAGKFEVFRDAFRDLLVRVYSKGWASYTNAQVKVVGTPSVDKYNLATVRAQVTNNGQVNPMTFMLWWDGSQWKIFDATFSNVSILTSYRNTFNTELQKGNVDALIAKMKSMN